MPDLLDTIISSSEVLALLIPLIVIIVHKPSGHGIKILVWYVIIAFIINLAATLLYLFHYSLPKWLQNNNLLYNLHSVTRVLFFSWYIISVRAYRFEWFYKLLLAAYAIFCIYNFTLLESPLYLSSNIFSAESIVLLALCLSYFLRSIQDEEQTNWIKHPSFLVAAGICLYEAITFFIFLFFYPLYQHDLAFSLATMRIYAITFVVLCILIAMAFYKSRKKAETKNSTGKPA
jgi:hypothetical protein